MRSYLGLLLFVGVPIFAVNHKIVPVNLSFLIPKVAHKLPEKEAAAAKCQAHITFQDKTKAVVSCDQAKFYAKKQVASILLEAQHAGDCIMKKNKLSGSCGMLISPVCINQINHYLLNNQLYLKVVVFHGAFLVSQATIKRVTYKKIPSLAKPVEQTEMTSQLYHAFQHIKCVGYTYPVS